MEIILETKVCNKKVSSKCITIDGQPIDKSNFPYQRRECHECFKHRQSKYYFANKEIKSKSKLKENNQIQLA